VTNVRESDLLAHIYANASERADIVVGPGDDCAVVRTNAGGLLLLTTDQVVEGRHVEPTAPVELIARKAVARSVSDIAAMGGTPTWALATGLLPDGYPHAKELCDQLHRWSAHFGTPCVGGDIATGPGPLVLTVTVLGTPHPQRGPVLRSGARAGDGLYVTGPLGGSLASGRHLTFEPRVEVATRLCDLLGDALHAMIDLSDGLGRDAGRIGEASGVTLEIQSALVPAHPDVASWREAVGDGEDYELLFASSEEPPGELGCIRIGRVVEGGPGAVVIEGERRIDAGELGWDHGQ